VISVHYGIFLAAAIKLSESYYASSLYASNRTTEKVAAPVRGEPFNIPRD